MLPTTNPGTNGQEQNFKLKHSWGKQMFSAAGSLIPKIGFEFLAFEGLQQTLPVFAQLFNITLTKETAAILSGVLVAGSLSEHMAVVFGSNAIEKMHAGLPSRPKLPESYLQGALQLLRNTYNSVNVNSFITVAIPTTGIVISLAAASYADAAKYMGWLDQYIGAGKWAVLGFTYVLGRNFNTFSAADGTLKSLKEFFASANLPHRPGFFEVFRKGDWATAITSVTRGLAASVIHPLSLGYLAKELAQQAGLGGWAMWAGIGAAAAAFAPGHLQESYNRYLGEDGRRLDEVDHNSEAYKKAKADLMKSMTWGQYLRHELVRAVPMVPVITMATHCLVHCVNGLLQQLEEQILPVAKVDKDSHTAANIMLGLQVATGTLAALTIWAVARTADLRREVRGYAVKSKKESERRAVLERVEAADRNAEAAFQVLANVHTEAGVASTLEAVYKNVQELAQRWEASQAESERFAATQKELAALEAKLAKAEKPKKKLAIIKDIDRVKAATQSMSAVTAPSINNERQALVNQLQQAIDGLYDRGLEQAEIKLHTVEARLAQAKTSKEQAEEALRTILYPAQPSQAESMEAPSSVVVDIAAAEKSRQQLDEANTVLAEATKELSAAEQELAQVQANSLHYQVTQFIEKIENRNSTFTDIKQAFDHVMTLARPKASELVKAQQSVRDAENELTLAQSRLQRELAAADAKDHLTSVENYKHNVEASLATVKYELESVGAQIEARKDTIKALEDTFGAQAFEETFGALPLDEHSPLLGNGVPLVPGGKAEIGDPANAANVAKVEIDEERVKNIQDSVQPDVLSKHALEIAYSRLAKAERTHWTMQAAVTEEKQPRGWLVGKSKAEKEFAAATAARDQEKSKHEAAQKKHDAVFAKQKDLAVFDALIKDRIADQVQVLDIALGKLRAAEMVRMQQRQVGANQAVEKAYAEAVLAVKHQEDKLEALKAYNDAYHHLHEVYQEGFSFVWKEKDAEDKDVEKFAWRTSLAAITFPVVDSKYPESTHKDVKPLLNLQTAERKLAVLVRKEHADELEQAEQARLVEAKEVCERELKVARSEVNNCQQKVESATANSKLQKLLAFVGTTREAQALAAAKATLKQKENNYREAEKSHLDYEEAQLEQLETQQLELLRAQHNLKEAIHHLEKVRVEAANEYQVAEIARADRTPEVSYFAAGLTFVVSGLSWMHDVFMGATFVNGIASNVVGLSHSTMLATMTGFMTLSNTAELFQGAVNNFGHKVDAATGGALHSAYEKAVSAKDSAKAAAVSAKEGAQSKWASAKAATTSCFSGLAQSCSGLFRAQANYAPINDGGADVKVRSRSGSVGSESGYASFEDEGRDSQQMRSLSRPGSQRI